MPTFLVLKSGTVTETIRGANPSALTAAVRKALAGGAAAFQSKGYTLGSTSQPSRPVGDSTFAGMQRMLSGNGGLGDVLVRFVALYFTSLFTFDSYKAAEASPFNIRAGR
jgi:thioredoxin 1